jgi:hypothetical protein
MALVERVKALAEKKGCTAGQLALAWLMHKGDDIYPIPGQQAPLFLQVLFEPPCPDIHTCWPTRAHADNLYLDAMCC